MKKGGGSLFEVIKNPIGRALIFSAFFSQIGIWVRNFSVLLFVTEQTNGNAFAISLISIAEYLPIFLFSVIGGAFADRWPAKKTIIICELLSSISVFIVLLTLIFGTWKAVFFATLISSILSQISIPSSAKLLKTHLPENAIQQAISFYQTIAAIFMIVGPLLGTAIFQTFGIYISIMVTGVAFILSVLFIFNIPNNHHNQINVCSTGILQDLYDGIRYVLSNRELKQLGVCFTFAGFAMGLIQPLNIFIVMENLQLDKGYLKYLLMINGVGMILGGLISLFFASKFAPQKGLSFGALMNAVAISIIGFSESLWLTMIAQFLYGLFLPIIQISVNSMILKNTKDVFIGRVNGIMTPLMTGTMVVSMFFSGFLKNIISIVVVFQISAVLFFIASLVIFPLRGINHSQQEKAS